MNFLAGTFLVTVTLTHVVSGVPLLAEPKAILKSVSFPFPRTPKYTSVCPINTESGPATLQLWKSSYSSYGAPETVQIQFLAKGTAGCVYDIVGGFKDPSLADSESAVVKTPRVDMPASQLESDEVQALADHGILLWQAVDSSGREWVVMKKIQGAVMWEHPKFNARFPKGYNELPDTLTKQERAASIASCEGWLKPWQEQAVLAFKSSILDVGWDNLDTNWKNLYFTFDEPIRVIIIDWGQANNIPGDQLARDEYWDSYGDDLKQAVLSKNPLPLRDTEDWQGICQSDLRDSGVPYRPVQEIIAAEEAEQELERQKGFDAAS